MDDNFASSECLYRGLHPMWIEDDNTVYSAAFKDSSGVSVDRDGGRTEQECVDKMVGALSKITGVGKLTCGDVQDCGAVTKYLPVEGNEYHSEIHDTAEQVKIKGSKSKKLADKCQLVFKKEMKTSTPTTSI